MVYTPISYGLYPMLIVIGWLDGHNSFSPINHDYKTWFAGG